MATRTNEPAKTKDLQSAFTKKARGSGLAGRLITTTQRQDPRPPQSTPDPVASPENEDQALHQAETVPPGDQVPPAEPPPVVGPTPEQMQTPSRVTVQQTVNPPSGEQVEVSAEDDASPESEESDKEPAQTTTYLHPDAYKKLVRIQRQKFRDYAQITHDAFVAIRAEAQALGQDPDEFLAALFANEAVDEWLMPEPQSNKSSVKAVEARISFKPEYRKWLKERKSHTAARNMSAFLAVVLEHYLLAPEEPGKKQAPKKGTRGKVSA